MWGQTRVVTTDKAIAFLQELLDAEVEALEPLKGGDWSVAYGFKADGRNLVARFGRHVDDFQKDRAASRFSSIDLPVPDVVEIAPTPEGYCCVSQRLYGEPIDDVGPDQMRGLVPAVLRLWDSLRKADISFWIAELGAPEQTWTEQLLSVDEENERVHGWHDRMRASPIGIEPFEKGMGRLRELARDCPDAQFLQHNDLLHWNVLVQGDRITAVFDWGCAGLGDFLYDLAIFEFYRPWMPSVAVVDWAGVTRRHYQEIGLDVPDFDLRLKCYLTHVGLTGMAYCAFIDDEAELLRVAERLGDVSL